MGESDGVERILKLSLASVNNIISSAKAFAASDDDGAHVGNTGCLLPGYVLRLRMKSRPSFNVVGPQVRKFRANKGWSQGRLAQKLQLLGWNVSRHSVAKLELQLRRVPDCELIFLAKALGININEFFPKNVTLRKIGPAFQSGKRLALFPTRAEK